MSAHLFALLDTSPQYLIPLQHTTQANRKQERSGNVVNRLTQSYQNWQMQLPIPQGHLVVTSCPTITQRSTHDVIRAGGPRLHDHDEVSLQMLCFKKPIKIAIVARRS